MSLSVDRPGRSGPTESSLMSVGRPARRSTVPLPRSTVPLPRSIRQSTGPYLCMSCTPVDRAVDQPRLRSTGRSTGYRLGLLQAPFLLPLNFNLCAISSISFYLLSFYRNHILILTPLVRSRRTSSSITCLSCSYFNQHVLSRYCYL